MRRVALHLVVLGALLRAGLIAPAHADCLPAADLSGDADVAAEVARALARLGVVFGEADGACAPVIATVLADATGVAVTVRDARGRIEGRVVADASTAAAWIESWASDDAALLWSAVPRVVVAMAPAPPSAAPVVEVAAVVVPRRGRAWRLPGVAVRLGRDFASDGSSWDGVGAAACLGVGRFCFGLEGRYAVDAAFTDTGGLTSFDRSATEVSATAAVRASIARLVVAPEVSLGVGAVATRRREPTEPCIDPNGMQPCPDMPLYIGDGFAARTYAPRLGAALGLQVPLAGWLALDARLGAEAAPGAHTAPHLHDAQRNPTDPTVPIAPGDPLLDLPGEPAWAWTAAIGLRAEVP